MGERFVGTIDERGYTPPPGVRTRVYLGTVLLGDAILNPDAAPDYIHWLFGGNESWRGGQIQGAQGDENEMGEANACLGELFRRRGINRLPTFVEDVNFGAAHLPLDQQAGMSIEQARTILGDPTWGADREQLTKKGTLSNPWWVHFPGERYGWTFKLDGVCYQNVLGGRESPEKPLPAGAIREADSQPPQKVDATMEALKSIVNTSQQVKNVLSLVTGGGRPVNDLRKQWITYLDNVLKTAKSGGV